MPGLERANHHDEEWWIKSKLKHEQLSCLPPAIALRKDVEDGLHRVAAADSEATVRTIVGELNERIVHVNSWTVTGPTSTIVPRDVECAVERWRAMSQQR